jgi:hypothetical protein
MTFIVLSLLLTACSHRDAVIQQDVTGTWVVYYADNIQSTNVIKPDGGYTATVSGFTNGSIVRIEGTVLARDGALIETITNDSETNHKVPSVVHGRLIRVDDHRMVTQWDEDGQIMTVVAQKVQK